MSATALASSSDIRAFLVDRLNDALRRPGIWGGELGIRLTVDHLLFVEQRPVVLEEEQRALGERGAWPPTGVTGAFGGFLPSDHGCDMASVYAEFAHRQRWLKADRVLDAGEYAQMLDSVDSWAAQDRVWADVVASFGPPSVLIGSTNPYYGKTLGYLTDASSCAMVFFHLWNGTDPGAKPSWPPLHEQPLLLAVRHGDRPLAESFTFTPEGQRRRLEIESRSS